MSSKRKTTATKNEATPALVPELRFPEFRGAGNWGATTIGSISDTVIAGGTPSTSDKSFWGGEIRWMNSGELNDKRVSEVQGRITREGLNNSSTKLIPPRCVLIGLAGQGKTRGTVAMNLVELCTNQSIAAIFPNDTVFNSDFLYHDLDKRYDELRRLSAGGEGRGGLNLQIIKSLKIALPSLPEQQKIAECLTSVDELMAAQARKVDALKTHKKGLMQQLFPREGETQPRLRFPEFQNAGEWVVSDLGSLSDVRDGTHDSPAFSTTGRPLVTSKNLRPDGTLDLENVSLISEEDYEQINKRSKVAVGDILFGMIGTIGNPVLLKSEGFAIKNVALIKELGPLSNAFVVQLLQSDYVAAIFAMLNTGNSQKFIALGKIRELPVPVPSLPEQQRIASCLSSLDALITLETQKREALKIHKKGLMQQLFPSPDGDHWH